MIDRPPCWPERQPCPNRCATRYYRLAVYGDIDLAGDFAGWRIRGRYLIAPGGFRFPVRALRAYATKSGLQGAQRSV